MLVSKRCAIVFSKWGKFLHSWGKRCAMGVGQVHVRWGKLARRVASGQTIPRSTWGKNYSLSPNCLGGFAYSGQIRGTSVASRKIIAARCGKQIPCSLPKAMCIADHPPE